MDRHGGITSHGPVFATPQAGLQPGEGGGGDGDGGGGGEGGGGGSEEPPAGPKTTPRASWKPHGEPGKQSLRVLERSSSGVTLELVTGGFYSQDQPDGSTKLIVPGFFDHDEPGRPSVPTRRLWQDAIVGRGVTLVSVEPSEFLSFSSLRVPLAGNPVALSTASGTYEAASLPVSPAEARKARAKDAASGETLFPATLARVHQTAFQGETKMAYVELSPLRVDETTGRITLARRLLVRLAFTGRVTGEQGRLGQGRRAPDSLLAADAAGSVLARFATTSRGLHSVAFAEIPGLAGPTLVSSLRLSRLGSSVPFHVEPRSGSFGPGSVLYFLSDGSASAYSTEAVYELAVATGGITMPVDVRSARRISSTVPLAHLRHQASFETNFNYSPSLTEARDLWLWDYGIGARKGRVLPLLPRRPSPLARARKARHRPPGRQRHPRRGRAPRPRLPQRFPRRRHPLRRHAPRHPDPRRPLLAPPGGHEHPLPPERRRHRGHLLTRLPRPLRDRVPTLARPHRRPSRGHRLPNRQRQPRGRPGHPPLRHHLVPAPIPRARPRRGTPRLERRAATPLPRRLPRRGPQAPGPSRSHRSSSGVHRTRPTGSSSPPTP